MKCRNCGVRIIPSTSDEEYGRALWEDEEKGTIGCASHPEVTLFEAAEEVAPHVPAAEPNRDELRTLLEHVEAVGCDDGVDGPAASLGGVAITARDLLRRLGAKPPAPPMMSAHYEGDTDPDGSHL